MEARLSLRPVVLGQKTEILGSAWHQNKDPKKEVGGSHHREMRFYLRDPSQISRG